MSDDATTPATPQSKRGPLTRILRSHDFARDITVTTLGVLIALGIGEVVEDIRWKFRIDATERAMRDELGLVHAVYVSKILLAPCVVRRIAELDEVVGDARRSGRLPAIGNVSFPPNAGGFGDSWTLATGSEVLLQMNPADVLNTATLWANEDVYAMLMDRERDAFDRLAVMENRPGPVSDDLLTQFANDINTIKVAHDNGLYIARMDVDRFEKEGIKALFEPGVPLNSQRMKKALATRNICKPLKVNGRDYVLKGKAHVARKAVG